MSQTIVTIDLLKAAQSVIRVAADRGVFKLDEYEAVANVNKALVHAIETPIPTLVKADETEEPTTDGVTGE